MGGVPADARNLHDGSIVHSLPDHTTPMISLRQLKAYVEIMEPLTSPLYHNCSHTRDASRI